MGPTPILEMARAYGLRPRLWLLGEINSKQVYLCLKTAQRRVMAFKAEDKSAFVLYSHELKTLKSPPEQNFSDAKHKIDSQSKTVRAISEKEFGNHSE